MSPVDFCTTNISDGETIHQRCLLVKGTASSPDSKIFISIKTLGPSSSETFPEQTWPTASGYFKALVMLSPGHNSLQFTQIHNGDPEATFKIDVTYIPLLQYPPLHLAIMVARDSPLIMDCPPAKGGGFSSAHSDLDAAISKFRMTAYMWQAMTAEDLRVKGLGRRAFRLDEEWIADTVSRDFINAGHNGSLARDDAMRATAKIHIVRSSRTTSELRDANIAQQNPSARRQHDLFDFFKDALKDAGGPFTSSAHPIVAGLYMDSHYSMSKNLILGHAALGSHDPNGISLGTFGSHLTYSWPRFLEEVTSCLTDTRSPGDKVGNDNGECTTFWEACTIGQGAFIHEVGHAFGSPHRSGIMQRGYAQHWPRNFLTKTAYCKYLKTEGILINDSAPNNARWSVLDALSFRAMPHFRLPSDRVLSPEQQVAQPVVDVIYDGEEELNTTLRIESTVGIVRVKFNDQIEEKPTISEPVSEMVFAERDLEGRFDRSEPLSLRVLASNGRETTVIDVWRLLTIKTFVRIPGSNIRLFKRSVYCDSYEINQSERYYEWAQLLKEKGPDGNMYRATSIDLRVGACWDGGVVKYEDGHVSHWGPMHHRGGRVHSFGGHASEEIQLPSGVNIKRIQVNRSNQGSSYMDGIRMHLSNRTSAGELNQNNTRDSGIVTLKPAANEVIVGFYGKNGTSWTGVVEFGIITALKSVGLDGLPEQAFELSELRNNDRVVGWDGVQYSRSGGSANSGHSEEDDDDDDDDEDDDEDDDNDD